MTQRFSSSSHEKKTPKSVRRSGWSKRTASASDGSGSCSPGQAKLNHSQRALAEPYTRILCNPRRQNFETHQVCTWLHNEHKFQSLVPLHFLLVWREPCPWLRGVDQSSSGDSIVTPEKKWGRNSEDDDVVKIKLRPLWKNKWVLRSNVNCNSVQRSIETFTVFGWSRWLILTKEEGTWYDCTGLVHSDHEVQNFVPGDKAKQQ